MKCDALDEDDAELIGGERIDGVIVEVELEDPTAFNEEEFVEETLVVHDAEAKADVMLGVSGRYQGRSCQLGQRSLCRRVIENISALFNVPPGLPCSPDSSQISGPRKRPCRRRRSQ